MPRMRARGSMRAECCADRARKRPVPIRYVNRSFNQATLAGFYRIADIALVTPLRDGMNVVAKEHIAAQPPESPGVLVLSSFAGAADELDQAIIINPLDIDDIANSIETALAMGLAERRQRRQAMFEHLLVHDIAAWRKAFLTELAREHVLRTRTHRSALAPAAAEL